MSKYIHPIEKLVHSTVRMECRTPNGVSSGTGFFFGFQVADDQEVPCIVTNRHVVEEAEQAKFHLTLKADNGGPSIGTYHTVIVERFNESWIPHPDENIDLAIVPIAPIITGAKERGFDPFYVTMRMDAIPDEEFLSTLPTMEEIIMIGYPNGIWDSKHNLPIIRKGITATHPRLRLNDKPEFMIDAACFPGSSGSPVFLANIGSFVNSEGKLCAGDRIGLLGILYAGPQHTAEGEIEIVDIPTAMVPISKFRIPNNLGVVIHASELRALEEDVKARFYHSNQST